MSKRTTFTSITPLPKTTTRAAAVSWLHNHVQMIRLNPLVLRLQETTPPPNAAADEYNCAWYEITDEISYLPGGLYKGEVTYKACFNDLPNGIQTHTFAPAGLDLRGKWTVGGNEPGEPRETLELGMDAPRDGLYVREDVDMRCNIFLTGFVKKNLTKAHKSVVDKLAELGEGNGPGKDVHHSQDYDGTSGNAVPRPWQNNEQALTPVDSNTMFSPDSYLKDPPQQARQSTAADYQDPSSADLYANVGHHPSPYRENPRSHLHSHTKDIRESPARSAPKLSYREHERIRDMPPQLPPLDFLQIETNSQPGAYPPSDPYGGNVSAGRNPPADTAPTILGDRHPLRHSHSPSIQAELPTERSPTNGPNKDFRDDGVVYPTASYTSTLLNPGTHATTQRLSTDFTWQPGAQPGGYI
ncbi:hypothetical protein MBLNU13_g06128t1 [Cladosporium sp. NU13]